MRSMFKKFLLLIYSLCNASYHEQYRVPAAVSERWESYIYNDKEYLVQNLPVTWENARILCGGHHNGTLAELDTRNKAEFLAEALSESQFAIDSLWVGARRASAEDPAGYRWVAGGGSPLRRTALDVLASEDSDTAGKYPLWLNRTLVPVAEGGADCVALERVQHDKPVLLDLPCSLERAFACERELVESYKVSELRAVRCRSGVYRLYDGRLQWQQAAAYCLLRDMTLANIGTMQCLRKIGMAMLKTRPSIESAWVGARGTLGHWSWSDTGENIFRPPAPGGGGVPGAWPPMRDRSSLKQSGCLQVDRHVSHPPVFMEARCERKMQFICYQAAPAFRTSSAPPSDDIYYYVLVRQLLYWQHAFDNCNKMNGTLAAPDTKEILIQLLLLMGENKDEPVSHIWVSGRLNMSTDGGVTFAWHNPYNGKRIPDHSFGDTGITYVPPWLDEEYSMDSPCLNLDRQAHLAGLLYGLPCDTPQYSVCLIEKSVKTTAATEPTPDVIETPVN